MDTAGDGRTDDYREALDAAHRHALEWLDSRREQTRSGPIRTPTASSRAWSRGCPKRGIAARGGDR